MRILRTFTLRPRAPATGPETGQNPAKYGLSGASRRFDALIVTLLTVLGVTAVYAAGLDACVPLKLPDTEMNGMIPRLLLAAVLLMAGTAASANDNLWFGAKVGTLGIGVEARWQPIPWLDLRAGANRYDYDDDGAQAGIAYDATLELDTLYATANLRFPLSPMRLSLGVFDNGNALVLESRETGNFVIGGQTYASSDVGQLRSTSSFDSPSPYLGLGFDFELMDRLGLNLDLGVLWQGDPAVTLTADGVLASDPAFQQALENERQELESESEDFKAWPVISLGLHFNFF